MQISDIVVSLSLLICPNWVCIEHLALRYRNQWALSSFISVLFCPYTGDQLPIVLDLERFNCDPGEHMLIVIATSTLGETARDAVTFSLPSS